MNHNKSENVNTAQFRAVSGQVQAYGLTPREALDALMNRLPGQLPAPITIWPFNQGDVFYTNAQQARLQEMTPQDKRSD